MNQEKIGKFITECRKEKNLTQLQLAEKLNIGNPMGRDCNRSMSSSFSHKLFLS